MKKIVAPGVSLSRVHQTSLWDENGKERTKTFRTEDAARDWCSQAQAGQAEGTWITKDKRDITVEDLWGPWIATKEAKCAPKTIAGYKSAWQHLAPVWGATPVCEVDGGAFTLWVDGLKTRRPHAKHDPQPLGSGQKRKIGIIMGALMKQAVKQKIIPASPLESGDIVKQTKGSHHYLRVSELDALINAAPTDEAQLLIRVLAMTAIRPGEAKGLKVGDLDYYRGRLTIRRSVDALGHEGPTKNRLTRDVPVGGDLLIDLDLAADGKADDDWLLPDEVGHVWTDARWRRVWRTTCTAAGLTGVDTYTLKHTAVSMAIASGADVYVIQESVATPQPPPHSTFTATYGTRA
ncbi:site-specific recombinase, phage integrase family [Corynebacterium glucuronolyticum ATCC 51867]|nr:site-specific recombinase, phage integrase family [Corynebacterium glucuronolyticum ATCC 51867]